MEKKEKSDAARDKAMDSIQDYLLVAAQLWQRLQTEAWKQGLPPVTDHSNEDDLGFVRWVGQEEGSSRVVILSLGTDSNWKVYTDEWGDEFDGDDIGRCVTKVKELLKEKGIIGKE